METGDGITLRTLRASDGLRLSRIDERITGRNRSLWYERKLERALRDSDMNISLGAEVDGILVGAVLGSVQYGEFGIPEPVAVLDTILVDSLHSGRGIASAMIEELASNLSRLGVDRIRTEIEWKDPLSRFLGRHGFELAPVLVLERSLGRENTADVKET